MKWLPEENIRPCATMKGPGIVKTMVYFGDKYFYRGCRPGKKLT
jgi:hypothetical protein